MALQKGIGEITPSAAHPRGGLGIRAPLVTSASWQWMMGKKEPLAVKENISVDGK